MKILLYQNNYNKNVSTIQSEKKRKKSFRISNNVHVFTAAALILFEILFDICQKQMLADIEAVIEPNFFINQFHRVTMEKKRIKIEFRRELRQLNSV